MLLPVWLETYKRKQPFKKLMVVLLWKQNSIFPSSRKPKCSQQIKNVHKTAIFNNNTRSLN